LDKAEAEREIVLVLEEKKSPGIEAIKEKSLARGEKRGVRKGREKGIEEGIALGVLKGREEGREEGLAKGRELGLEEGREEALRLLVRIFERRLGRPLAEAEQKTLAERARTEGAENVADLVAESGEGLITWLLDGGSETKAR